MNIECPHFGACKNSDKCFRCSNERLYKPMKKANKSLGRSGARKPASKAKSTDDDSWKHLEQTIANELNNVPTIQESRRSRGSGAFWFEKGDIVDELVMPECKERKGLTMASGEKSFSMQKLWLTKAREEAFAADRIMILPFRFKNDSEIYTIMNNDDVMTLITTCKSYMRSNEELEARVKALTKKITEMEKLANE